MPAFTYEKDLPEELKSVVIAFLDKDVLTSNSDILHLRSTNKYFYELINLYWSQKYSIKQILCADKNTYLLLENGDLYGCGSNGEVISNQLDQHGQMVGIGVDYPRLGLNSNIPKSDQFVKISSNVKKFFIGRNALLTLNYDNQLYGVGNTSLLGLNDALGEFNFTYSIRLLNRDERSITYGFIKEIQLIPTNFVVKDIATNDFNYTLLLAERGQVYACGLNFGGQFGTGDYRNLDVFTKIFDNAEKIFATSYVVFILSTEGLLYAAGVNEYQIINSRISEEDSILSFTPIEHASHGSALKDLTYVNIGFLFLYDDGNLYLKRYGKVVLISTNVEKVNDYNFGILLLKKDGSLLNLKYGSNEADFFTDGSSSYIGENLQTAGLILSLLLSNLLLREQTANRIIARMVNYYSTLIKEPNQVSDLSCHGKLIYHTSNNNTVITSGRQLFFSDKQQKRLYAAGKGCLEGQLALPGSRSETNGCEEIFENLPTKNKLLQGRALMR